MVFVCIVSAYFPPKKWWMSLWMWVCDPSVSKDLERSLFRFRCGDSTVSSLRRSFCFPSAALAIHCPFGVPGGRLASANRRTWALFIHGILKYSNTVSFGMWLAQAPTGDGFWMSNRFLGFLGSFPSRCSEEILLDHRMAHYGRRASGHELLSCVAQWRSHISSNCIILYSRPRSSKYHLKMLHLDDIWMIYPRSWSNMVVHDPSSWCFHGSWTILDHGYHGFPSDASQAYTHCQILTSATHLMVVAWRMQWGITTWQEAWKVRKIQCFLVILPFKASLTCREKSFLFGVYQATSTRRHPAIPRRTIKKCGTWSQGSSWA